MSDAKYISAADALCDWRDSVFSGAAPRLYKLGSGGLGQFELGPGRVVLLGGLPGGGKTALATQLVVDGLRAEPDLRAVICNVEMTHSVLLDRQLARLSGVGLDLIAKRRLGAEHAERIDCGIATLEGVGDRLAFCLPPFDLANVAATADAFGGELLIFDYLQRIAPPGQHGDRRGSVDALMDFLRQFANAGCSVLAVSAMARTKDRKGRSSYSAEGLSLASFRESSELEYGADTAYVLAPDADDTELVTLRCLKHRHGEPRHIPLHFEKRIQRFTTTDPTPTATDRAGMLGKLSELWAATPAADESGGVA